MVSCSRVRFTNMSETNVTVVVVVGETVESPK